jgi:beta-galactosidase
VWNQFDFGSNHRQDTKNAINQKGLFFFDRTPKDIAHWYRAVLTDEPVLHIEREHPHRAATRMEDRERTVQVFTNADRLAWRLDASQGEVVPENHVAVLEARLSDGAQRVEVTGTWDATDGKQPPTQTDATMLHFTDLSEGPPTDRSWTFGANFGGTYSVTGPAGLVYVADARALEGDSLAGRTHHRIYGTDLDPLFQAYRELSTARRREATGRFPAGTYTLTFGFMEPTYDAPGQRVFSVLLDGVPVITDLDLAAEAGRWTAVERAFTFTVAEEREVRIEFVPSLGLPILNSLVIQRH